MKLFIALVASASLALVGAPIASASESAFVDAIRSLNYYAIDCPGCAEDALDVGYRVCAAFDQSKSAAVQTVLNAYNGPGQEGAPTGYYATLFAQYAAYELCLQHNGKIRPI